mgnify:CR=1 FL=1
MTQELAIRAEDTVMSNEQIYKSYAAAPSVYLGSQMKEVALAQAQISFRIGQESERKNWVNSGNELLSEYPEATVFWQRVVKEIKREE